MVSHRPLRMPTHPALAYFVHDLSPFLIRFGEGFGLRWYGLAYVAAFAAGYAICLHLSRRGFSDIAPSAVGDFITGTALFGVILGGRLGYMLFYDWHEFAANPLVFFQFWEGGMSSHGGILGIVVFTWIYARRKNIPWLNVGDTIVVAAPVGLLLGRCANFVNGELYGRATTVPWAVQFPKETYDFDPARADQLLQTTATANPAWNSLQALVENASDPRLAEILSQFLTPRHPSQLYAAFLEGALLFTILWILRTRLRLPDGILTAVFFIGYAVLRILGEAFREPDAPLTGLLTRGQFLSLFLIAIGVAFLIAAKIRPTWAPKFR
jgi:phosphatidylglycerol---prolipoprotein diacylglyceryl transferase